MLVHVFGTDEPPEGEVDIVWEIEHRHLAEAEFAFECWEDALDAPHYTLAELAAGTEERLLAHVDALVVAGPIVAERLLLPTLRDTDAYPERVAAAVLACPGPVPALDALCESEEPDLARGLARGLELRQDNDLDTLLIQALPRAHDVGLAAMLEVLARRGRPIEAGIADFARHPKASVARAAAMLLRACPDHRALDALTPLAQSEDPDVCVAALASALIRGVSGAWELAVYWAFTPRESPRRRSALVWVALLGEPAARARLLGLLDDPAHRIDAVWAAGFAGTVAAVRSCLSLLDDEELGPLAGEAIHAIVGLPVDDQRLWRERPRERGDALPTLSDDNLEKDLSLAPEYFLPIPDPDAIRSWWATSEGRFDPNCRYLYGRHFDASALAHALRHAPLRRRHNLALELAARSQGTLQLSTRALTSVQLGQLERLTNEPNYATVDYQRRSAIR
jgi:uncharacterized protein (TIGR02270 family)